MSTLCACPSTHCCASGSSTVSNSRLAPAKETSVSRQAAISWLVLSIIALIALLAGTILIGISTMPAHIIMFSGAYFTMGCFCAFLAAGVLVGTVLTVARNTLLCKKKPTTHNYPQRNSSQPA